MYWETCGNPAGKPAVVLHGGPGSGCTVGMRRSFDPNAYRIVLLDQRGAGRSTPRVTTDTDLSTNTTDHLIADLERLRTHLGIERWLVWGASWGTTLALAYAERHPERVSELVLASIALTRPSDIHWLYHETGRFFPEQWERFREGVPEQERDGDLVASYNRLLNEDPDPEVRRRAALCWCDWEDAVLSLESGWAPSERFADPAFRITFARIVAHYFHHRAWLRHDELLQGLPPRRDPGGARTRADGSRRPCGRRVAARARMARCRAAPRRRGPRRRRRDDGAAHRSDRSLRPASLTGHPGQRACSQPSSPSDHGTAVPRLNRRPRHPSSRQFASAEKWRAAPGRTFALEGVVGGALEP